MSDYPALENFLAAYFHQDWAMEHDTPEAVVDYYRSSEAPAQVAATRDELARLLDGGHDEDALAGALRAMGSEFDPRQGGGSVRDWLLATQARLAG